MCACKPYLYLGGCINWSCHRCPLRLPFCSYEELAVGLALDLDRLHAIRSKLEDSRLACPLFDTARWVKNFEAGLKLAWSKHEMGLVPSDIDIPDAQVRRVVDK